MAENTLKEIREFLSVPEKPVGTKEMADFWRDLSDEEKAEFKSADLK